MSQSVMCLQQLSDCEWSRRSAGRLFQIIAPVTAINDIPLKTRVTFHSQKVSVYLQPLLRNTPRKPSL